MNFRENLVENMNFLIRFVENMNFLVRFVENMNFLVRFVENMKGSDQSPPIKNVAGYKIVYMGHMCIYIRMCPINI